MDIDTLTQVVALAKDALASRKRLARIHANYVDLVERGGNTRARTTTYHAEASNTAERAKDIEQMLKTLINGQ